MADDDPIDLTALRDDDALIEALNTGRNIPNSDLNAILTALRDESQ